MPTTFRVPCPRHSPESSVLFHVTEEHTRQGKLAVLTCVVCGFNADTVMNVSAKPVPTKPLQLVEVRPSKWIPGSSN